LLHFKCAEEAGTCVGVGGTDLLELELVADADDAGVFFTILAQDIGRVICYWCITEYMNKNLNQFFIMC